jgi:hypothetical protein
VRRRAGGGGHGRCKGDEFGGHDVPRLGAVVWRRVPWDESYLDAFEPGTLFEDEL